MSGSPGGGGGGWDTQPTACDMLDISTQLSSPKAAVIAGIAVGDVLDVALQAGAGTAVVVLHKGQLAGGLASPDVQRLRECLEGGTQYGALVREINGAQVKVRVRAIGA
jgi:hypothetical protein